jgi:hypothetical protein
MGDDPDSRIPRGAVIVVAIGLLACIVAPLLTHFGGSDSSEFAHLFWVKQKRIPDSKPVEVPGGKQKMQLVDGGIRSTGTNVSGYSLFRVLTTLKIEKGAPTGEGKILCTVRAGGGTEIARSTGGLRATYPRSSEAGIYGQEVPESVVIDFSSHGHEAAVVEVGDVGERFTSVHGVKLEWPEYEVGTEHLEYLLGEESPPEDMELPFYTIWKTLKPPSTHVSCELTTKTGSATVHTAGKMAHVAPPIDEEAEEATQEAKEESEEGSAAEESTSPEEAEEE